MTTKTKTEAKPKAKEEKEDTGLKLKIYKTHPEHELPKFATKQSACFDLAAQIRGRGTHYEGFNSNNAPVSRVFSGPTLRIMPGDRIAVPTGLIFDIPEGYSVRIHPRSGLSLKKGLILANAEGVIDSDYVEEVLVLLVNTSNNPIDITHGERIAQAELVPVLSYEIEEAKKAPEQKTDRDGGLGSTGV